MKLWLLIVILLVLAGSLVFGGLYLYKLSVATNPVESSSKDTIGIFDITQNCTMTDVNEMRDCCKGICDKYCKDIGKTYVNHFLNQNNNIQSCYCWC